MKHTKKPWKYEFNPISAISPNGQFTIKVDDEVQLPIAVLPMPIGGTNTKEKQEASAKIISKAPEAMTLLEQIIDSYHKGSDEIVDSRLIDKAKNIIEKLDR